MSAEGLFILLLPIYIGLLILAQCIKGANSRIKKLEEENNKKS